MRTVIIGGPRTGKTHHAAELVGSKGQRRVRHSDDLIDALAWSEVSQKIADQWLEEPGPWICEGVAMVRALRKWLLAHPEGKPCDEVISCTVAYVPLTPKQASMAKGHATIWAEVEPQLRARGVVVRGPS